MRRQHEKNFNTLYLIPRGVVSRLKGCTNLQIDFKDNKLVLAADLELSVGLKSYTQTRGKVR
jgi:hypothetical protein